MSDTNTTTNTSYITVRRAAELAGVSYWTIRKWIKKGRLQAKQRGGERGHLLIDTTSLVNLLEQTVNE
jgi:excisionase family DNA binding protein